jgi:hypothetical protein
MRNLIKAKLKKTIAILALLFSLALIGTSAGTQDRSMPEQQMKDDKDKVVYVCSCLKTKSCSCMTEAKTEGPCACGTAGGPPMKAVARNSAWAKTNREALAK